MHVYALRQSRGPLVPLHLTLAELVKFTLDLDFDQVLLLP
jgi:hypothetical protein